MERSRRHLITASMMLSLFLASIETTVVAAAMPSVVMDLGGMSSYPWVFSAYMLASTAMMSISGKLSDLYGRRPVYLTAMCIFLFGSVLCGCARSMGELVAFRAVQGIGAGGLLPLSFTIIGDLFKFEERARIQGLFSSVWGFSSLIGPAFGGFLVDHGSWRWVFLLNIPPGIAASALMVASWRDVNPRASGRVDAAGGLLLAAGVACLLLTLYQVRDGGGSAGSTATLFAALSAACFAGLWIVEGRAENPVVPLRLFRDRFFSAACGHGFLTGFTVFGAIAALPLFFQLALGSSPTAAGTALTPLLLGWVVASNVGSRLLLGVGPRWITVPGMTAMVGGCLLGSQLGSATPPWLLSVAVCLIGVGMGLSLPVFMIGVQSRVPRDSLGSATASLQFFRSVGGAFGVTVMGLLLMSQLAGSDGGPASSSVLGSSAIVEDIRSGILASAELREALTAGIRRYFVFALLAAVGGWICAALIPTARPSAAPSTSPLRPAEEVHPSSVRSGTNA